MKKLLALLLSVIMAMSLAVPAFAEEAPADGDPGFWLENWEPAPVYTPGDAIPISALLPESSSDASLGIIGGADGPTTVISTGPAWTGGLGVDLSTFTSIFTSVADRVERVPTEEYLADHPGLEEELRANAYDYFAQEYGEYWTAEEYMEFGEMTEEDFLNMMVSDQVADRIMAEAYQKAIDDQKEALGGVLGQVGVMVNGTYIKFPDAAPEVADGRTMVPVRALVEALGGEVDYEFADQKDSVRLFIDKYTINFTIGGTTAVRHTRGTDTGEDDKTIEMDCAPYIKDGRTYVPVRFLAEALGYEVGWDSQYETAILLDRAALAADVDKDFAILNRVQANRAPALEEGKSWSVDMKGGLSLTLFDTLNGNQTYKVDLTGNTLMNREAANGTCSLTISDNAIDALMEQVIGVNWAEYEDDEDVKLLRSVLTGLQDMEVIMTREGRMWFHAPILDELSGEKNVWAAMDMGAELGALMFAETDTTTVGSVLASMVSGGSVTEMVGFGETVKFMDRLYSDDCFTTSGGVSTLTIGVEELMALYEDMGLDLDEIGDVWKEYNITMKVDGKGAVTGSIVMETSAQSGIPAIRITMDSTQSSERATVTMECHVANIGEAKLTLTTTQRTTSEAPKTEPPEGATIVDEDLAAAPLVEP